jgi:signal transduction histidine kinase
MQLVQRQNTSTRRLFGFAGVFCAVFVWTLVSFSQRPMISELRTKGVPVDSVLFITHSQSQVAGRGYPERLPMANYWEPAQLPDNWDGNRKGFSGYVWYRLEVPQKVRTWHRPTLYVPAAGMNAELWLNGRRVDGAGRMTGQVSRHFYTPQLMEIPPALLEESNEMYLLVVGYPGYRCGLAPVWLGEHDALFDAWRQRRFWQVEGNAATIVINLSMAVFVLLMGFRDRTQSAYLWFGASAVVWAMRNLNYWVTNPIIPDLLFAKLCVSGSAWFVALFAIFSMRFTEAHFPGYRGPRWFKTFALAYALIATTHFLLAPDYASANSGFMLLSLIGIGLTLWSVWRLLRLAWTLRTTHLVAVAAGATTYLLLLLNDFSIGTDTSNLGEVFMRQYAALPLFIAITTTLGSRYREALQSSQELAASLQTQVEQQRKQIQHSFDQLRDAEHEQTRAQERARVMGDLHDGLGMHLATALRQVRNPDLPRELLASSLQDCLDELRVAVDSLDEQERDPLSLLGSLRFRMAPRFESVGMRLEWKVADDLPDLPMLDASGALHLLRIVQEILGNALKHSHATLVTLSLTQNNGAAVIAIVDNGRGFDPSTVSQGRGLGHLQTRAAQLGAQLHWLTAPVGASVKLTLPNADGIRSFSA